MATMRLVVAIVLVFQHSADVHYIYRGCLIKEFMGPSVCEMWEIHK
jgi:hypothetical protein